MVPLENRWTSGRALTDVALVPIGLKLLVPEIRGSGTCGQAPESNALLIGLLFLAARALKALNDATISTADTRFPMGRLPQRKPKPLDDL